MNLIFASDYDGTLNQDGIAKEAVTAIEELQSRGGKFGIVTGRDYAWSYKLFKEEGVFPFDFVISNNGALAVDKAGKILFSHSVAADIKWGEVTFLEALVRRCIELTSMLCVIAFEERSIGIVPESIDVDIINSFKKINSLSARCTNADEAKTVTAILAKEFGSIVTPHQNNNCIDITPIGVNKCRGIEQYAELIGARKSDIWTAGDNYNDVEMLKNFHGCAMSSGVEDAKNAAEYTCDGIEDAIKIILKSV